MRGMDFFRVMGIVSAVTKMVADIKAASADGKITPEEISKDILGNVLVLVKLVDPSIDVNRLLQLVGENSKTMLETQQLVRSLPGDLLR